MLRTIVLTVEFFYIIVSVGESTDLANNMMEAAEKRWENLTTLMEETKVKVRKHFDVIEVTRRIKNPNVLTVICACCFIFHY